MSAQIPTAVDRGARGSGADLSLGTCREEGRREEGPTLRSYVVVDLEEGPTRR